MTCLSYDILTLETCAIRFFSSSHCRPIMKINTEKKTVSRRNFNGFRAGHTIEDMNGKKRAKMWEYKNCGPTY